MLWFVIIGVLLALLYYKTIKPILYWKGRGVIYKKSYPIVGSLGVVLFQRRPFFNYVIDLYREFSNERYFGVYQFGKSALYIRDLDLIKKIAVTDFNHFTDHNSFTPTEFDPQIKRSMINLEGQRWRDMRATLSPSFTSSKMKIMFNLLSECAEDFTDYFDNQAKNLHEIEMKDIFTRFTNDAIATTAFGLKCNSVQNKNDEFYLMARKVTNVKGLTFLVFLMYILFPNISRFLQLRMTSQSVSNFFRRIIKETIRQREKEDFFRPDMIHLLMEARKGTTTNEEACLPDTGFATAEESNLIRLHNQKKIELSDDDIAAQVLLFIFGGIDTTSALLSFTAYELAINPSIQEILQNEVDDTLSDCNGKLTYEVLNKMKYMDMVISETLRKWPPGFQNDRICVKDYTIEPLNSLEKPILIEKGTLILFPVSGIHHDPQYFPNPEVYDPERFNDENRHNIKPCSYIPFGVGPRNCIASRFALMESKVLMFHLLSKFNITRIERTPVPLKIAQATINFVAEGGFWLGLEPRMLPKVIY